MDTKKIFKLIELAKANKNDEIISELTSELLKADKTNKSIATMFNAVKKYLKKVDNSRPVLKTIMKQDNTQFICNGYSLYVFKKYITEFDNLPNAEEGESLNYKQIVGKMNEAVLTDNDWQVLNNIKQYINYIKATKENAKNDTIQVYFNNKIFNAEFLLELKEIMLDYEIAKVTANSSDVQFENDNTIALILAMRANEEEKEAIKNTTIEFLNTLKNN